MNGPMNVKFTVLCILYSSVSYFRVVYSVHFNEVNSSYNINRCTILYFTPVVLYISCYMFRRYIAFVRELDVGISSLKVSR